MNFLKEELAKSILDLVNTSFEPLETKEIGAILKNKTRVMILYRLNQLRAEGLIKGKQVGAGKGTWIWWRNLEREVKKK
jgi:hypothetical protein